jgi:hypothetical protein
LHVLALLSQTVHTRIVDPYRCTWCELLGLHEKCTGLGCECTHQHEPWVTPSRRAELRAGAEPQDERERALVASYRAHRIEREAADAHRG